MKAIAIAMFTLFFSVVPAFGQGRIDWQPKATVTIPFAFVVNNVVLPAGDYEILTPYRNAVFLKNKDTGEMATASTVDIPLRDPAPMSKLLFRRDGDKRVLHQFVLEFDNHVKDLIHGKDVMELASR